MPKAKKMKRPSMVRIIGKVWSIDYVKQGNIDLELYGTSELSSLSISIQDELPESLEQETVLHEVMHGVDHSLDLEITEAQISSMACVLMQIFKDNPEFLKYLAR